MIPIDGAFVLEVAPRFSGDKAQRQSEIVGAIGDHLTEILDSYDINSRLRIAHFMGQVTHECAGFRTCEEFASGAAYENRADLGNIHPGDGKRYKGRGLLQLTGRDNYRKIGSRLGLALEDNPEIAAEPLTSLRIACEFWKDKKINPLCDADDLIGVTRKVNGGTTGLEDRRSYYRKARVALARREGIIVASQQSGTMPVLRRASFGDVVERLQRALNAAGFAIAIDADFGPATELAVRQFQAQNGLEINGIVAADTWRALDAATP